jgi:hypothetical protein
MLLFDVKQNLPSPPALLKDLKPPGQLGHPTITAIPPTSWRSRGYCSSSLCAEINRPHPPTPVLSRETVGKLGRARAASPNFGRREAGEEGTVSCY